VSTTLRAPCAVAYLSAVPNTTLHHSTLTARCHRRVANRMFDREAAKEAAVDALVAQKNAEVSRRFVFTNPPGPVGSFSMVTLSHSVSLMLALRWRRIRSSWRRRGPRRSLRRGRQLPNLPPPRRPASSQYYAVLYSTTEGYHGAALVPG
jgi:hypothetical protein